MTVNDVHTWTAYKEWVNKKAHEGKKFFYRGQMDAAWQLKTTFHRAVENKNITMDDYLKKIVEDMRYHVSSHLNEIIDTSNKNEFATFLALLRHHGFPTPLLDWTMSPYIAAYFAFRDVNRLNPLGRKTRVFVFDFESWRKAYSQPDDLKSVSPYVSVLRPFAKYNPRQITQNCVYTITNVPDVQAHILRLTKNVDFLYQFNFSSDIKDEVMSELDLMGISEMNLYPGLDGLCRTMKRKYFEL